MKSIVEEKLVSFKELEQKVFKYVCELGCEITRVLLETYDRELAATRDTRQYRDKGKRRTCIKTVYGTVEYERKVYKTSLEDGKTAYVYLLDQAMQMDKIGLISTNLAEKLAMTVTESPYRTTADIISSTCGQSISAGGVWKVMQRLGERISEEEDHAVKQMNADQAEGQREIPVLFEEMDGVWLNMQDEHHKKMKKQEMKVFTMYEGWDEEKEKNIGADNHRSDDTGSIFYYLSSLVFHCIYRNKINCRTNYTACKSAVEFLCTDACCIAGLYHCVWTIFLWFCLCIWNMGGFRLFYFIYDSQKKKKETVEMFFKSGKDTPVFKICCTACCPASLYKRLQ